MRKVLYSMLALLFASQMNLNAQVTIGANEDPKATLEVIGQPADPTPAGVIAPRVTVAELNAASSNYGADQTGAIVYVTDATDAAAATKTGNISAVGYYYFDGSNWQGFGGGTGGNSTTVQGAVKEVNTSSYTVTGNDYLIVTTNTSTAITFPALTAADAGKTVVVFNKNADSSANNILGTIAGNPGNNNLRGLTMIWSGSIWVVASQQ